jgi:hypothetical protein
MDIAPSIYHQSRVGYLAAAGKINEITRLEVGSLYDIRDALILLICVTWNSDTRRPAAELSQATAINAFYRDTTPQIRSVE